MGTRYAACQCVRALSRAVAVLRTNIVDSGLGMDVLKIVLGRDLGEKSGGKSGGNGTSTGNTNTNTKGKEGVDVASEKDDDVDDGNDDNDVMEVIGDGDDEMKGLKAMKGLREDRRVVGAALAAVCNILTDFSPLRPVSLLPLLD